MKHVAVIVVTLLLVLEMLVLYGCSSGKVDSQKIAEAKIDNNMFMVVSEEWCGQVLVDKSTGVMYWNSNSSHNYGTLTLLINHDGTPRIWEE